MVHFDNNFISAISLVFLQFFDFCTNQPSEKGRSIDKKKRLSMFKVCRYECLSNKMIHSDEEKYLTILHKRALKMSGCFSNFGTGVIFNINK